MGNTTLIYTPFRAQNLGLASQSSKIKNANNDPNNSSSLSSPKSLTMDTHNDDSFHSTTHGLVT